MNNLLEIKICGINDQVSMNTAINNNVNYIGLVFYDKSPRNLSISKARLLIKNRNNISKIVALTVNPNDHFLQKIKQNIKPDYIQLHGEETPNQCKYIRNKFSTPLIKGIGIEKKVDVNKNIKPYEEMCDILILDAPSKELPGGNGKKFDWQILNDLKLQKKWLLAGGLNIKNISEAVYVAKPPGIDISSGIETEKGFKDPKLIKDFILKCRNL